MKWQSRNPGLREMTQIVIHEANPSENATEPHMKGVMNKKQQLPPSTFKNVVAGRDFFPWISLVTSASDPEC